MMIPKKHHRVFFILSSCFSWLIIKQEKDLSDRRPLLYVLTLKRTFLPACTQPTATKSKESVILQTGLFKKDNLFALRRSLSSDTRQ